jgi:hypothetical protein
MYKDKPKSVTVCDYALESSPHSLMTRPHNAESDQTFRETRASSVPRYAWTSRIANAAHAATKGRRREADRRGEALGSHG